MSSLFIVFLLRTNNYELKTKIGPPAVPSLFPSAYASGLFMATLLRQAQHLQRGDIVYLFLRFGIRRAFWLAAHCLKQFLNRDSSQALLIKLLDISIAGCRKLVKSGFYFMLEEPFVNIAKKYHRNCKYRDGEYAPNSSGYFEANNC